MLKRSDKNVVFIIILIAFALRFTGITHGFPFIFHPDEPTIIRSALEVRFYPNPGHFDWPHLYIYVNYFIFMAFAKARDLLVNLDLKAAASAIFPLIWNDGLVFYYITRLVSLLLGALTVIPVYLTGKKLFGSRVGLLAAFTFAVLPFHVRHSHYSLPDVPMVFLVSWAMYFSSRILVDNTPGDYAGGGFYTGLAASTKYNGGLSAVFVPVAHLVRIIKSNTEELFELKNFTNLFISGFLAVLGFLAGTPYAYLDFKTFIRTDGPKGALWQFTNVGSVPWAERFPKFINEMIYKVSDDTGYVILAAYFFLFIILIYKSVRRRVTDVEKNLWFIFLPSLFFLYYISGFESSRSHYFMIAYPMIALAFGYFATLFYEALEQKARRLSFIGLMLLFMIPSYYSFLTALTFLNGDTRNVMHTWLRQNSEYSNAVIYEAENTLNPVFTNGEYVTYKDYSNINRVGRGFLVFAYTDKSPSQEEIELLKQYSDRLGDGISIRSTTFLGPNILIYKIK